MLHGTDGLPMPTDYPFALKVAAGKVGREWRISCERPSNFLDRKIPEGSIDRLSMPTPVKKTAPYYSGFSIATLSAAVGNSAETRRALADQLKAIGIDTSPALRNLPKGPAADNEAVPCSPV